MTNCVPKNRQARHLARQARLQPMYRAARHPLRRAARHRDRLLSHLPRNRPKRQRLHQRRDQRPNPARLQVARFTPVRHRQNLLPKACTQVLLPRTSQHRRQLLYQRSFQLLFQLLDRPNHPQSHQHLHRPSHRPTSPVPLQVARFIRVRHQAMDQAKACTRAARPPEDQRKHPRSHPPFHQRLHPSNHRSPRMAATTTSFRSISNPNVQRIYCFWNTSE